MDFNNTVNNLKMNNSLEIRKVNEARSWLMFKINIELFIK